MCLGLMGPNAGNTMAGKALIRGLQRSIRDMPEAELRANLTDIRNRLDVALNVPQDVPQAVPFGDPLPFDAQTWDDASNDSATLFAGD